MVKRPMLQQALHLGRFLLQRLIFASLLAAMTLGCGGAVVKERTISDVTLLETSPSALDTDDVLGGLVTAEPRTFFWVETERDVYDANLVARDLERIERFERRKQQMPPKTGEPWTEEEDRKLLAAFDAGRALQELAAAHERTMGAVRARLLKYGRINA